MTIFLYDPSGQIVLKKDAVYKSDINDIESLSRQAIEEFIKSKMLKVNNLTYTQILLIF